MRRVACLLVLGLSACELYNQDVDAGLCIDCDWRPPDARWLAIFAGRPGGQQNCDSAGQKATWIRIQEMPEQLGKLGCVPDGTAPEGGSCAFGPTGETTGYDNCAGGFVCSAGICTDICAFGVPPGDLSTCATGTCTVDAALFANGGDDAPYGVCR